MYVTSLCPKFQSNKSVFGKIYANNKLNIKINPKRLQLSINKREKLHSNKKKAQAILVHSPFSNEFDLIFDFSDSKISTKRQLKEIACVKSRVFQQRK